MAGRLASSAAFNLAAACASPAAVSFAMTRAGRHSTFALTCASQLALQSALAFGGFTSPLHFGSLYSTLQPPEHSPLQSALPFIVHCALHLPSHFPLHRACAVPEQRPSQTPAHCPPLGLPSHLPLQVASHFPLISASHEPSHCAVQFPLHCAPAS